MTRQNFRNFRKFLTFLFVSLCITTRSKFLSTFSSSLIFSCIFSLLLRLSMIGSIFSFARGKCDLFLLFFSSISILPWFFTILGLIDKSSSLQFLASSRSSIGSKLPFFSKIVIFSRVFISRWALEIISSKKFLPLLLDWSMLDKSPFFSENLIFSVTGRSLGSSQNFDSSLSEFSIEWRSDDSFNWIFIFSVNGRFLFSIEMSSRIKFRYGALVTSDKSKNLKHMKAYL